MKKMISVLLTLSMLFATSSVCFAGSNTQMVGYCTASNVCCVESVPSVQTSQRKEQSIIEDLEFTQDEKSMDSSSSGLAEGGAIVAVFLFGLVIIGGPILVFQAIGRAVSDALS